MNSVLEYSYTVDGFLSDERLYEEHEILVNKDHPNHVHQWFYYGPTKSAGEYERCGGCGTTRAPQGYSTSDPRKSRSPVTATGNVTRYEGQTKMYPRQI